MRREDLKTGMKVVYRNGDERFVLRGTGYGDGFYSISEGNFLMRCFLKSFKENLKSSWGGDI